MFKLPLIIDYISAHVYTWLIATLCNNLHIMPLCLNDKQWIINTVFYQPMHITFILSIYSICLGQTVGIECSVLQIKSGNSFQLSSPSPHYGLKLVTFCRKFLLIPAVCLSNSWNYVLPSSSHLKYVSSSNMKIKYCIIWIWKQTFINVKKLHGVGFSASQILHNKFIYWDWLIDWHYVTLYGSIKPKKLKTTLLFDLNINIQVTIK